MGNQLRMSGLISGMDTDSVISQLVEVRRTKVTAKQKEQTKLSWKQDAWKDLNSKLKSLQSKYLATMRFSTAYTSKKTTVSNPNVASVIAGSGATDSVQTLKVNKLAKSGYLTGGEVETTDGTKATALTKLSELGFDGNETFTVKNGKGEEIANIDLTGDTTISDVLSQLKSAGLNASFDETNQRLFVSSKTTGAASDFSFESSGSGANSALTKLGLSSDVASKVNGQDAEIELNDAKFTSSTNVFAINGLTITATGTTAAGEEVTLTTSQDTSGIYNKIKDFLKEYNEIINQIDKLYGTKTDSGYEPLTDEEKEAMSESEIEKYEQKIKDGILYHDSSVSTVGDALKGIMSSGFTVGGKTLHLSDFGISTLSYFTAADYEKHAYHIDGDSDDENTSGNSDKLASMIASDPDTVTSFFQQLSNTLYMKMSSMSKSVDGYRSFGNFYDDKKMASDYTSYTTKISEMEEKVNDYEDKLYKKFSAMETALAKLQSKSTALSGLLGN